MPWLLNVVYIGLLAAVAPLLLYRRVRYGKYRDGWAAKLLGRVTERPAGRPRVWFHAVSVGEVLLLKEPIARFRLARPDAEVVLSVTTATGMDVARRTYSDLVVFYCPLDFSWAVRRAICRLNPTLLVLVELELWPNLILAASAAGVRTAIVNGRLSEKSFRGYRRIRPLVARLLRRVDCIAAQSDEYAARFLALGAPADRVATTGSVKFDGVTADRGNATTRELRKAFGLTAGESVLVAGSTQEPEEEIALAAWRELRQEFPTLRLILVPRHKERFEEVAAMVARAGEPLLRRSATSRGSEKRSPQSPLPTPQSPILLLDTLGELGACWGLADVAFVGGSLTRRGGQNMIEPAAYGAAVLFGPNVWNFKDAASLLLAADAARIVRDGRELTAAVTELLRDESVRRDRGDRARAAVTAQKGATDRTVSLLADLLPPLKETRAA